MRVADSQQSGDRSTSYHRPAYPPRAQQTETRAAPRNPRAKEFQTAQIKDQPAAMPRVREGVLGEGVCVRPVDVAVGADNGHRRHRPASVRIALAGRFLGIAVRQEERACQSW